MILRPAAFPIVFLLSNRQNAFQTQKPVKTDELLQALWQALTAGTVS
jgi:hypothetical protein